MTEQTEQAEPTSNITGLMGPWGIPPETDEQRQQRQSAWAAEEERTKRDNAVMYAVRAFTPAPGSHTSDEAADYVIALADRLGDYIQNGKS